MKKTVVVVVLDPNDGSVWGWARKSNDRAVTALHDRAFAVWGSYEYEQREGIPAEVVA